MNRDGKIAIRLAVETDIEPIGCLDRIIDHLPHWSAEDYRSALADIPVAPPRCLFVGESESTVVGLAAGVVHAAAGECWGELETVGVASLVRRHGLGRMLCRAVIDWCRAHGAAYVDLEVRSCSGGPIALYCKLGFEIVGRRPGYYREPVDDALLMRLYLEPVVPQ